MLKTILLLSPVYVTLFWSVILSLFPEEKTAPRAFLGKFMIAAFVVYVSHLLFFSSLSDIYCRLDPFYQLASLMVYPLFYIYIRLLTTDKHFSFRKHYHFLILPIVLFLFYLIGAFFAPADEYKKYVFNRSIVSDDTWIKYLKIVFFLMRVVFVLQVIVTISLNYQLIKKYGSKAAQYYSEIQDTSVAPIRLLNLFVVITAVSSIVLAVIGRDYFKHELVGIAIASAVFTSMLFIIGLIGYKQISLNPVPETLSPKIESTNEKELNVRPREEIIEKIKDVFERDQCYLNSQITIQDVANKIGTNRTYISSAINYYFQTNFCTFVNQYRIEKLIHVLQNEGDISMQHMADLCGFGSVDSMKRAVFARTNIPFNKWKEQILKSGCF